MVARAKCPQIMIGQLIKDSAGRRYMRINVTEVGFDGDPTFKQIVMM